MNNLIFFSIKIIKQEGRIMGFFKIIVLTGIFFFCAFTISCAECVIKMTYKDGDKLPLIAKNPDNSGAYLELFTGAAKKIGCRLEVIRSSKKRLHKQLQEGKLDFYPGASFSKKRSKYLYYIENGFDTGEYGITSSDIPFIDNYQKIKDLELTWILELGSSKTELANELKIPTHDVRSVTIDLLEKFISKGRNVFYIGDKEVVDYYLKSKGIKSFKEAGLKVHKECCGGEQPMYMGFSRFSPHFKENPNPDFNKAEKISPTNFPMIIDPACTAYKLGKALQEMKETGETEKIYAKYFSK